MRGRRDTAADQMRRRFASSFLPAIAGALIGYFYGLYGASPDASVPGGDAMNQVIENRVLPAMYGCMGAIIGILLLRLTGLFRTIFSSYFGKDE